MAGRSRNAAAVKGVDLDVDVDAGQGEGRPLLGGRQVEGREEDLGRVGADAEDARVFEDLLEIEVRAADGQERRRRQQQAK